MKEPTTPQSWANLLSQAWGPRYPIEIERIALEYSNRFEDPIRKIAKADIDTFEGALFPLPKKGGWAILYNPTICSSGRINFTLAHELGHYLLHRARNPAGFRCGQPQVLGFDPNAERRRIEQEADQFASYLLMPMDDYRKQINQQRMTLDLLRHCADRYDVSLTAAALKWLEFTPDCAALVVARDDFVLWCWRSEAARKARIYYPKGMGLPPTSLAMQPNLAKATTSSGLDLASGVWSARPCREMAIFTDRYDLTISLVVFEDSKAMSSEWMEEEVEDTFDHLTRHH